MLFDPFKKLDLPPRFVQGADGGSRQTTEVIQEHERLARLSICDPNTPQMKGILLLRIEPEHNDLIAQNPVLAIAGSRIEAPEISIRGTGTMKDPT